jgi:hypothetical protein
MCNGIPVLPGIPCPPLPQPLPTHSCHGFPLPIQVQCPPAPSQLDSVLSQVPPVQIAQYLVACLSAAGSECPIGTFDAVKRVISGGVSATLARELDDKIAFWELHTRYCVGALAVRPPDGPYVAPFPAKDNADDSTQCDDQDMTMFNGLLCSVGDARGCDAVRRAQAPDGQWWRSPRLIGHDRTHGGAEAQLSEEQTWGVFLYLLATKNKPAFDGWVDWIEKQGRPCWVKVGSSCQFAGLPQWCTDTTQAGACNFLPYECVVFESLAREFERDPVKALNVSRRIGCDLVMGVSYGAAAGALGALFGIANGLPALFAALPEAVLHDPQFLGKISGLAKDPNLTSLKPTDFPFQLLAAGLKSPVNLPDILRKLPLPAASSTVCVKDLPTFGLPLPPLPPLPNDGCVIPPPIFPAAGANDLHLPPFLGSLSPRGFTNGYPVQTQVLAQSAVPYSSFYAYHKVGVQVYLLQRLGLDTPDLQKAAEHLRDVSSENPFFIYLAKGASKEVVDPILKLCPDQLKPQPVGRSQWSWERDQKDQAWIASSYWDCIFAAKLLVNHKQVGPPILVAMQAAQDKQFKVAFAYHATDLRPR